MQTQLREWAIEEFAGCRMPDARHSRRLVAMAERVAGRPAGKVTEVFNNSAEREGAFRFLENPQIGDAEIQRSMRGATLRRCVRAKAPYVVVAVDGSSLSIHDPNHLRVGFGKVGAWKSGGRGLHVMSALAMLPDGTPLGLCDQRYWARVDRRHEPRHDLRPIWDRETSNWTQTLCTVADAFAFNAANVRPWFQLDRGGDCWPVLMLAARTRMLLTVRAVEKRRVEQGPGPYRYLWHSVLQDPVLAYLDVDVPAREDRPARRARLAIRARRVSVRLVYKRRKHEYVDLNAVYAREVLTEETASVEPLDWKLFSTAPIDTVEAVKTVLRNYSLRWRIEEFHRAWKSGVCNVEHSQLRSSEAFTKWATILASVAARALHLTHIARTAPNEPSTTEFSPHEVDAVLILKKKDRFNPQAPPKLGDVVRWIAELGGYTGPSSGGPPGAVVIGRGLERIRSLAEGLQTLAGL